MNQQLIDTIVNAVLYEGHTLYPARACAKKIKQRFTVGRVFPEVHHHAQNGSEPSSMQTECLIEGATSARVEIIARFLQPMERDIGALAAPLPEMPAPDNPDFFHVVSGLEVEGQLFQSGQEAVERAIAVPVLTLGELCAHPQTTPFSFAPTRTIEPILDPREHIAGVIVRRQEAVEGVVEISAEPVDESLVKVTVRIVNLSPVPAANRDDAEEIGMRTFVSTHTILHTRDGEFVSLIDPPEALAQAAASCKNLGTWPILVGDEERKERDTLVSSPIILYDYPKIALHSPDEDFDSDEIDEILAIDEEIFDPARAGNSTRLTTCGPRATGRPASVR